MPATSVIFLGAKPIGTRCLQYLLAAAPQLDVTVTGVLTKSADNEVAQVALLNNIPLIASPDEMPACDIMLSVQYHQILKPVHISRARRIAVNLHMAPLPEYRGCNQFSFAILENKKEFGTTLHCIDQGIDSGDILFEKRFPVPENTWVETLYHLTEQASLVLFQERLPAIINGNYQRIPQATLEVQRGTSLHYRSEIKDIKCIDLNWNADRIQRHIRATYMPGFEPPYAWINGQKIYFSKEGAWQ